jgi:hypothetical protein
VFILPVHSNSVGEACGTHGRGEKSGRGLSILCILYILYVLTHDCKHNILTIQRKKLCALADHKFIKIITTPKIQSSLICVVTLNICSVLTTFYVSQTISVTITSSPFTYLFIRDYIV